MLPDVLSDQILRGQQTIYHLGLAGPPPRRVIFRKGKSGGEWEGWGSAGQRAEVSIFYILYFNTFIYAMEIKRGQRDTKRKYY